MFEFSHYIGGVAAVLASPSYIPQVRKAWRCGSKKDLSLGMLVALTSGLTLWIIYGWLRGDWVIVIANAIGATLTAIVLACKLRDRRCDRSNVAGRKA
jgi:MtN3 and saliva related transmembrane protein